MIINNCQNIGGEISMKNKKVILILTALITFIVLGSMSFAQECITDCTDNDFDKYTPDTTCNTNESCPSCKCNDCDDTDPTFNPGAEEKCASVNDENCNGLISCYDPACCDAVDDCTTSSSPLWIDFDRDTYTICENDCDDTDPIFNPGADELCLSVNDENCNGLISCEDPECAGQTGPEGELCCQDASDCIQDNCVTESCTNNACAYINRPQCDATECNNQERCDSSGGNCANPDLNSNVCNTCYNGFFDETMPFETGTTPSCCNDDSGEHHITQGIGTGACCNSTNDCVDASNMCRDEYLTETTCNDGIDNDCDGLTDSDDEDCSGDPSCAPEESTCKNTEECCDDLKCKKQTDSPEDKICCSKDMCASTEGCAEENTCITTNFKNRGEIEVVCAHESWRPETTHEWSCMDKIDNDCDGAIDCEDEDCNTRAMCNPKCTTDNECSSRETCKNGKCTRLFCKGCAYPEDHICKDWECCTKRDCAKGEMCWEHECITTPESTSVKNKYTKENAKSAIETAQQNILRKKFSGDKPKDIKTLEVKLKNAKTAYNNGEYEKSESITDEITTGKKQKESAVDKIKGFMNSVKSFFMRSKEKENKPYTGSNIIPKI